MRDAAPGKALFVVHREQIAKQALEENLLCPFHYFGITDLEIDGEIFNDESGLRNSVSVDIVRGCCRGMIPRRCGTISMNTL